MIFPAIPKGLYDCIWTNHKGSKHTKLFDPGGQHAP